MKHWSNDAIFYHIYPLGFCGAPEQNDFCSPVVPRLEKVGYWLDHLQQLGVNALYLGPLFESSAHGYDTADYYQVDRRLGDASTLKMLSQALHARGMRLILDGVFNHVGRDFWAFRDVRQNLSGSIYCGWFDGLRFDQHSPYGDPFNYTSWNGYYELVKLNLHNPWVRQHLFDAISLWAREFEIDGLRLDVADSLDLDFLKALSSFCHGLRPDFWLMGEVIHGDYRRWVNPECLDSVTNYEGYKSLFSSHVDHNYFEIAYALNRQFGESGMYRNLPLYAFADNHDVDRVASSLKDPAHLYPLYCLLFSMPGVPSIYYGSEWGLEGRRDSCSDQALRPCLDLEQAGQRSPNRDLAQAIARLAHLRQSSPALKYGDYRQVHVNHEQLVFLRQTEGESALVAVNASAQSVDLTVNVALAEGAWLADRLNPGDGFRVQAGRVKLSIPPYWGRILI